METDFQEEYVFTLPRGYRDEYGTLHKNGVMRLANAADEILPMKDPRVQQNPSYLTIILLARVVKKLGDLPAVDTKTIEKLYTMDLAYLQDLYQRINMMELPVYKNICPHCGKEIQIPVNFMEAD
ncbi:MAG: phage tail assembly protein [Lachnospiraceae bacterium]|nr:phage tail assembly protein [Lachnospiraceae bacterium]